MKRSEQSPSNEQGPFTKRRIKTMRVNAIDAPLWENVNIQSDLMA